MLDSKMFRVALWILLVFLIIFIGTHISFVFRPLVVFVTTLFAPVLIAGILFYLMKPLVNFMEVKKIHRTFAISLLYLVFMLLLIGLVFLIGPVLHYQISMLINNVPALVRDVRLQIINSQDNEIIAGLVESGYIDIEAMADRFSVFIRSFVASFTENIARWLGTIGNVLIVFVTIPFILFYMLKDGKKLPDALLRFLPNEHREEGRDIMVKMDSALSAYIQGLIIVSLCVGVMVYIGYMIIGMEYALLLSIVATITNVIPFFGPFIGAIPAVIVGLVISPIMMLKVALVIVVAQQIESNLLSPQVMGRKLAMHPLTIIFVLMAASRFAGFLGLVLAVPTYAVIKVIVTNSYKMFRLHKKIE